MDDHCSSCKFIATVNRQDPESEKLSISHGMDIKTFECRIKAPVKDGWPKVEPFEWCGEHKPAGGYGI